MSACLVVRYTNPLSLFIPDHQMSPDVSAPVLPAWARAFFPYSHACAGLIHLVPCYRQGPCQAALDTVCTGDSRSRAGLLEVGPHRAAATRASELSYYSVGPHSDISIM